MKRIVTGIFTLVWVSLLTAQDLKDPRTRDETITNTQIGVAVSQPYPGFYEYLYTINSASTNRGEIISFSVDLSCDRGFDEVAFPEPGDEHTLTSLSMDGLHVPAQLFGRYANTIFQSISIDNLAGWGLAIQPGGTATGMRIVSTEPPGPRRYIMMPAMDIEGWAYTEDMSGDDTIPWVEDFTVTGITTGPKCVTRDEAGLGEYLGTGREPFDINKLISYSRPVSDPVSVAPGAPWSLRVHYHAGLDSNSFQARFNGKDVSHKFNPMPGTVQDVEFTSAEIQQLKRVRNNLLKLMAGGVQDGHAKGQAEEKRPIESYENPARERMRRGFLELKTVDIDDFHIVLGQ